MSVNNYYYLYLHTCISMEANFNFSEARQKKLEDFVDLFIL